MTIYTEEFADKLSATATLKRFLSLQASTSVESRKMQDEATALLKEANEIRREIAD